MTSFINPVLDSIDAFLAWFSQGLKQPVDSYCEIETADGPTTLVARDGSLISVIRIQGVTDLIGEAEFDRIHAGLTQTFQTAMLNQCRCLRSGTAETSLQMQRKRST